MVGFSFKPKKPFGRRQPKIPKPGARNWDKKFKKQQIRAQKYWYGKK